MRTQAAAPASPATASASRVDAAASPAAPAAAPGIGPPAGGAGGLPGWLRALAAAEGVVKPVSYLARHSRSFRFASRFLPGPRALEVAEIYAFCRFTDDIVDREDAGDTDVREARLDDWLRLSRLAYAGECTGLPLLDRPLGAMARSGVPFTYVSELVEGMRMDLRHAPYRTLADLDVYTYRVAGVVGQWLTELCGIRNPWALARAADLGEAMQLTNILRDVGEDWRRGRVYLPLDALARHGLSPEDLAEGWNWRGRPPRAYRDLMEDLMEEAENRYRRAFAGIPMLPEYFQRPVLVAALVYRGIHDALRGNTYDNFRLRAAASPLEKVALGIKASWILPSLRTLYSARGPATERGALPGRERMAYGA